MQGGRTRTFVEGFDEVLGGGIPQKKVVLIKGSTGTMKSSLVYYILYRNAIVGGKSLYVTFEQDKQSLEQQMRSLGLDGKRVSDRLHIFDLSKGREKLEEIAEKLSELAKEGGKSPQPLERKEAVASVFQKRIEHLKNKLGFELVAIDSLDALQMVLRPSKPRATVFQFFEWMRSLGLTCFVVSESSLNPPNDPGEETQYEDFLVDGIIELKMEPISHVDIQRRIRCIKMRGTKHSTDYYSFFCGKDSFEIAKAITY